MESITIDFILSKHKSCLHIFDPVRCVYSGAAYCSVCQFANSYLNSRRYSINNNHNILSLYSFCERFGLNTNLVKSRFGTLVRHHDSLNSYERFYFPSDLNVSHIHGVVPKERSNNRGESSNSHTFEHPPGDWCLSPSVRCSRGQKMELAGVVHTISEGSPTTSYATTCTTCSATIWHSGLGGQIIIFDILHMGKVAWDYGRGVFGISFIDGRYFQDISNFTAERLWEVAAWAFTDTAAEMMRNNPDVKGCGKPETPMKLAKGIAKVENGVLRIMTNDDSYGNFCCGGKKAPHSWRLVYPSIHLDLVFPPEVSFLVDHLMYPKIVGRARPGHAVRAYGIWGIPDYAPRFNQAYLDSVRVRKRMSDELSEIMGIETIDIYDDPDSDFGDEGFSGRGEAEMDVHHEPVQIYEDEETGEHYYIDHEDNPRWLADATDEELAWIYGDEPVEEEAPPAAEEEEEVVLVEEIPTATVEDDAEKLSVIHEGEELVEVEVEDADPEMRIDHSMISSLGSVLVDFSNATKHLGNIACAPVASLNKSIENFGTWLSGNEMVLREYTYKDFPQWVNNDFKHIIGRLGAELNNCQGVFVETMNDLGEFRDEVMEQFRRIEKMLKRLSKMLGKLPEENFDVESLELLRKHADRLALAENQISMLIERAEEEANHRKELQMLDSRFTRLMDVALEKIGALESDLKRYKKLTEIRHRELSARSKREKQVEEPQGDGEEYPVGGPAYSKHKPKKSYTAARSVGQMDQESVPVQADKPDSVLPVNPDTLYHAAATKSGDHLASASPDLVNMPSSRYLIEQFKWQVIDNEHVVINTIQFPGAIFEAVPWLKNTSQLFQYFRCNGMEITVTMTSNMMQGGVLFVGWDSMSTCDRRHVLTIYEHYNLPHGLMTAGKDAELVFEVGFDTIQERMSLAGFELGLIGIGSLIFIPLNGLVCTTATSQYCEIGVYVKLREPDFQVRTVIHEYKKAFNINSLAEVLTDRGNAFQESNVIKDFDFCRRNLIHTGKWTGTDRGRLCTLAVHPCIVKKIGRFLYPTSLAMVSSVYHHWRGSLKYTFIFGGNKFTTGKLHVCAIPGQYTIDYPSDKMIMGVGGRVINLRDGDTRFTFTVPWYGVGDMQRTCRHTLFDSMYYGEDLVTRMHVWIVDPLITNVGATSSLSYAVTVEPGEDFELMGLRGLQSGSVEALVAEGPVAVPIKTMLPTVPGAKCGLFSNWGHILMANLDPGRGMRFKVAPMYHGQQVDMNILSWFSNFYARWSGGLEYRFVVKPHKKNELKCVYFWHMFEDPHMDKEYGYESARLPPSGVPFVKWDLSVASEYVITVPFQSRFKSLAMPLSVLEDIKYHPTFYYNGVVHASYYGESEIDLNVYIRACPDFQLYGHGATTVISASGGDVTLEYLTDLVSVEGTPVNRKNVPLEIVRHMFEDVESDEEEEAPKREIPREPKDKQVVEERISPPGQKKQESREPTSARGRGQMDDGIIGAWMAKKILGEKTAGNLGKIDSEKVAKMVNWGCEASKFDFEALSGLVHKLVPLAENLNKRAEEASVFTQEGAKSMSFLGELSDMGGKLLELIKSLYKSSSLGWLAAQYDDGKITLAVVGTLALFFVGVMWWRRKDKMSWMTKVGSIIAILWAPEIGVKAFDLYKWIVSKLEGVNVNAPVEDESCGKAAGSSLQSDISVRGEAQLEMDFLNGMTDYAEVILSSILMVGSLFCLSMMPSDKTIGSWTRSLTGLGDKARAFTSIGGLLKMLQGWAKTISDCFMGWMVKLRGQKLVGDDAQLSALLKFGVADWVKNVSDLSLEEEKYKQVNDLEKIQKIRDLYDKGQLIKEAMLTHNFGAGTAAVFRDTITKCEKLINETYSSKGLGEPRIDPIHVAFVGKPGVGKSAVVQTFVKNLLDYMKYPQKDRIYSRSCADAFWSRYCRQPVVLYDDLGALTGDSTFSDYGEFINLKANVPYALNMAAVEDKGAMFQSHFLVSTSNAFFLDNNSNVRNPDAFYRRRDLAVVIERDPDIPMNAKDPTEGLLFTIVDTFTGHGRFTWPIWMGIEDGTFSLVRVPYRQFIVFCMQYTKGYMRVQQDLLKTFKANYVGDVDTELEVERMLADLVAQRSGSDRSPTISDVELGGESDEDFWGAPGIEQPPFPGAGQMFPVAETSRRGAQRRQTNPRDVRPFEPQMDRYVTEDTTYYTSLELIGMYTKWDITGAHLATSMESKFGVHLEELYKCKSSKILDHLKAICTCTYESQPIECDGRRVWDLLRQVNAIYVPQADGFRATWLTSQVRGLSARYHINFVPSEPWQIFCGLLQAVQLYTKHWGCPGLIFNDVDLIGEVSGNTEDEDEFVDTYEVFPVSVYDQMIMEDGVAYYDRDDFRGTYHLVCGTFGGIPLQIGGHHIFLGRKDGRRPGEVTEEEYAWVRSELTRKSCARVLESLIPAFSDMDIILMKQAVQGFTGSLSSLSRYENCGPLKFVFDRLGWGTYGMVLFYMLLATKEGINKRILRKKKKEREENEKIAEGHAMIVKEEQNMLSTCSVWMRRALVFGGLVGAGVAFGLSVWGVWKGISGLFGFVWSAFTPSDKSKDTEESPKETPKTEMLEAPQPQTIQVAEVIKERYQGKEVEMQAGTYGNSGDQKTRYSKRIIRKIVRDPRPKTRGNAHADYSDLGIVETKDGLIDGVQAEAVAHMKCVIAKEAGLEIAVPDRVKEQMDLRSRLLDSNEEWQSRMVKFNKVRIPKYLQEDGIVRVGSEKIVVVKGNTPFLLEKSIDPTWQGCFIAGRAKYDEEKIDKSLLAEFKQSPAEVAPLFALEATIGDDVERVSIQAEGGREVGKEVLGLCERFEGSMIQVLTTKSMLRFFGVMVAGSWMLIPAHFLMKTIAGEEVVHLSDKGVNRMRLEADRCFLLSKYQDLALVDLGPRCPPFTDIRKHFISNAILSEWSRSTGILMHACYRPEGKRVNSQFCFAVDLIDTCTEAATTVYDTLGAGDHVNVAGFKYPAVTGVGWCGSLLISGRPGVGRRILGIHTAGHTQYAIGYAEMVTTEALDAVMNNPEFRVHAGLGEGQMGIERLLYSKNHPKGKRNTTRKSRNLKEFGVVKPEFVPRVNMKTDIIKSPIHGLFGKVNTEPSILSPFDRRLRKEFQADGTDKWGELDPLLDAVEKYGEKTHSFPAKKIRQVEFFLKHHYKLMENSEKRRDLMSEDEAINGIEFSSSYLPLNMDTSPGWPSVLDRGRGVTGKKFLFEQVESCPAGRDRFKLIDPGVRERMLEIESEAMQGRHHFFLTVECSKDERRKKKKIYEEVATRSFTNLDVAQNLLYRKYFLNFGVMVQENFMKSFCKVGINVNGPEWSALIQSWMEKSPYGFAGDYAKFDGIGDPDIFMSICKVVNAWYDDGDENARVREYLLYDAFHRVSLVRNVAVAIDQGMPSGFPMTVIFNSIVNFYFLCMAWCDILAESHYSRYSSPEAFWELCGIATYGDDNVVAVPLEILEVYNLRSVAKWLKNYGISYTDDQKRPIDESEKWVPIPQVTFLKRGIREIVAPMLVVAAPLDLTSLEEQGHWIREGPLGDEVALRQNLDNALYEAHLHGKDYFDNLKGRLNTALDLVHLKPVTITFLDCLKRFWSYHMNDAVTNEDLTALIEKGFFDSRDKWSDLCIDLNREVVSLKELYLRSQSMKDEIFDLNF